MFVADLFVSQELRERLCLVRRHGTLDTETSKLYGASEHATGALFIFTMPFLRGARLVSTRSTPLMLWNIGVYIPVQSY